MTNPVTFERRGRIGVLLVHCDGRTFVAGGDITSFDAADFSAAPCGHSAAGATFRGNLCDFDRRSAVPQLGAR
jgi:enoyl-CoA hydratase/carnithine racemase